MHFFKNIGHSSESYEDALAALLDDLLEFFCVYGNYGFDYY